MDTTKPIGDIPMDDLASKRQNCGHYKVDVIAQSNIPTIQINARVYTCINT